jgi:putative heme-binding domain-containing protein
VAILENPNFGRAAHVPYVGGLSPDRFPDAIAAFLKQIESDPDYVWNSDVIFLLSHSTKPEVQELWRSKFDDPGLRNAVLMTLAEEPKEADRPQFIAGLENAPLDVLAECIRALLLLEPSQAAEEQVTLVRLLRRLDSRGMEREIRDQIVEVLQRNTSQHFDYSLGREGDPQQAGIEQWTAYIREAHPDEFAKQAGESAAELAQLEELLSQVSWEEGSASRGSKLFESRACIQCHSSRQALGPDLNGCAQRFSKEDLFTAIAVPSRDVSPRYQTTMIATVDGKVFTGLIVYESVDGLVLRNATNQTFRIEAKNIESRKTLSQSLMPNGLLKNMQPRDLADLYAFLRGMGAKTASAAPAEIRD